VLHYAIVNLVVGLGVAACVLEYPLLVLSEVAVVKLLEGQLDPRQVFVPGILGEFRKRRLEGLSEFAFDWAAGTIVIPVVGNAVDEEQAQDLHASAPKLKLLFQVLLDGVLDLHPPDILAHAAAFVPKPQDSAAG